MNFRTLFVVGSFAAALSAQAVTVTNNLGAAELVLGFAAPDSTVNLEVALGTTNNLFGTGMNYTTFNAGLGANQVYQVDRLNVADLNTAFGDNWLGRSDVSWAIAGFQGGASGSNIAWASKESILGVQSAAWARNTVASQNTNFGTKVRTMTQALTATVANGSNAFSAIVDVGIVSAPSWTRQTLTTTSYTQAAFQDDTLMQLGSLNPLFADGVVVSDLFQMNSGTGAGTYIGTFGIDTNGSLWYAANAEAFAIPEPSTYAMILAGLTLGVVAYRRRFAKQA